MPPKSLDELIVRTLRCLAIDTIEHAKSGHPGLPLGAAPMAWMLWRRHLCIDPKAVHWPNRDRFILSAGHGSALLYALMHLAGFEDVSLAALKTFRQLHSPCPGHPERGNPQGVEATTGPLGQGVGQAVGMAMAERALAQQFNRPGFPVVDHKTFVLASDGDLMEGVAQEAVALAGHLKLHKLCMLYDANNTTLDGPLSLSQSEDVAARFIAQNWCVIEVIHGDTDLQGLDDALEEAARQTQKPTLILVRTTIGFGSADLAGSSKSHGSPLGALRAQATKEALGADPKAPQFWVPDAVGEAFDTWSQRQRVAHQNWEQLLLAYGQTYPELAKQFERQHQGWVSEKALDAIRALFWRTPTATRAAFGQCLTALCQHEPAVLGGDGDLSISTLTAAGHERFDGRGPGRHIAYGVREHAMAAATCGMASHGGLLPFAATYLVFSDYMRPAVRLSALDRLRCLWIWTHDSIAVGEDGPTHQPVEQLMGLRAMPHLLVCRPADAFETQALLAHVINKPLGPAAFVLSRQALPVLPDLFSRSTDIVRGAYILRPAPGFPEHGILIATGSEVHLALEAQSLLKNRGLSTRVVSMPSWSLFASQPKAYRDSVLPAQLPVRTCIEAGASLGWERFAGDWGTIVGLDDFGASGRGPEVQQALGFRAEKIVAAFCGAYESWQKAHAFAEQHSGRVSPYSPHRPLFSEARGGVGKSVATQK